jgi:hypothetical protein
MALDCLFHAILRTRASSKCIDLQAESSSAPALLAAHPIGPLMGLITAFYAVFFRSPCDAQWTGNEKWGGRRGSCSVRVSLPALGWPLQISGVRWNHIGAMYYMYEASRWNSEESSGCTLQALRFN